MKRWIRRLAIAAAVVGLCTITGRPARAGIVLTTPAGLHPGDQFRIAFFTGEYGRTAATSSNIADYNSFVNAQAGTVTYGGQAVSFYAIGSTATVDAIDNIGVTGASVYLVDGTLVTSTDSTSGLWSGALSHPIDEDLTGLQTGGRAWTGTSSDGRGAGPYELGASSTPVTGDTGLPGSGWVDASTDHTSTSPLSMYGISEVLTVPYAPSVPEPSSAILIAAAVGVGLPVACIRRRRERRRR